MRLLLSSSGLSREVEVSSKRHGRWPHFKNWYDVVEQYSERALTVSTDKLLAIAGLAGLLHKQFGCEYGAGLWREDLFRGLCWYVHAPYGWDISKFAASSHDAEQDYFAPSWTWASVVDTPIKFALHIDHRGEYTLEEVMQVLNWEFVYSAGASSPFEHITSGVLTVSGKSPYTHCTLAND